MTPPEAGVPAKITKAGAMRPAALSRLHILEKRADFLRAARAQRQGAPAFMLQARCRIPDEGCGDHMRVGFTCSKKVGNAVARNRAKRRLREIARAVLPDRGRLGWDYVLIGRAGVTATRDFIQMQDDLRRALAKLHGDAP